MNKVMRCYKKLTALLLALSLTVLPACSGSGTGGSASGDPAATVAMGRYVEQSCDLPDDLNLITSLQQRADGSFQLLSISQARNAIELYTSSDGLTWTLQPQSAQLEQTGINELAAAFYKPDGTLTIAGYNYTDEFLAAIEEAGGGYIEDIEWPVLQFIEITPDGVKRNIPIQLPPQGAGSISQLTVAANGDIFALAYREVYQFDGTTGALLNTYSMENTATSFALNQNRLAVMSGSVATLFDTDSGDRVGTVEQLGLSATGTGNLNVTSTGDTEGAAVAVGQDGAYYFCNSTGIYRKTTDGELVERILDGSLVTLGTPLLSVNDIVVTDDSILVALRDKSSYTMSLKRYSFDPTVPTLPSKTLTLYALKENKTVRQAMGQYQLQNPDTHVVLEVAPAEQTTGDALRSLNTRLLAGTGPDILVLDGMPVEAYLQQQVLQPLDETLTEGLLPNLVQASRSGDGKLYTLPARFALPAMTGAADKLEQLQGITGLADYLAACKAAKPNISMVLQNCGGTILLNTLYPVFANELYADKKPDEAKLREFLGAVGQIADLQTENEFVTDESPDAVLSMIWTPIGWAVDTELMGLGYIDSVESLAVTDATVNLVEGSTVRPFSPAGSHLYLPQSRLGITTGSRNPEAATDFMRFVLAPGVQGIDFQDGLPVNEQALDQWLTPRPEEQRRLGSYGTSDADDNLQVVTSVFPAAEQLAVVRGWIDALDTPSAVDRTVLELLRTETEGYFVGSTSLDDTVASLMQKLTLLGAE